MHLYNSTNLTSDSAWQPAPNPPVLSNGNLSVTFPAAAGSQFFRLQWP
jgi:hypothetical protein